MTSDLELTILMPCLDEAETLETCVKKAQRYLHRSKVEGEVLIADNGSTDGSKDIATKLGSRVIEVEERGYGAALIAGIKAARGKFVIMGDADDSYDFNNLGGFVAKLQNGADLVVGNRFQGGIEKGAMPPLHKFLGNPVLSTIGKIFYRTKISDFHCGLRGFRRDRIAELNLCCPGMEFASEMIVKAKLGNYLIEEIPTTLSRDGRSRPPHLRSWRDGWRHLRFLLIFSPNWLFFYPGVFLLGLGGLLGTALVFGPLQIGVLGLDIHTLLYMAACLIAGLQLLCFSVIAKQLGSKLGLLPKHSTVERLVDHGGLEWAMILGCLFVILGVVASITTTTGWGSGNFGRLDPQHTMRAVIPSVTAIIGGLQLFFTAFFVALINQFGNSLPKA